MMMKADMVAALAALLLLAPAMSAQKTVKAPNNLTFGFVDGDDAVSIEIAGEDVTVLLNGEAMPKARYKRDGSVLRCLDPHGRPVAVLQLHGTGGTLRTLSRRPHRMRLGVSLRKLDEALAEHLGLDPEETIYIADVVNDQAGDKAGLRKHDVITHLDGERPATKARLGDILGDKSPGDTLALRVARRGGPVDVEVELVADAGVGAPFFDTRYPAMGFNYTFPAFSQYSQSRDFAPTMMQLLDQRSEEPGRGTTGWAGFLTTEQGKEDQPGFMELLSQQKKKTTKSGDNRELEKKLQSLDKRLGSLEKLLKGLDKKLK